MSRRKQAREIVAKWLAQNAWETAQYKRLWLQNYNQFIDDYNKSVSDAYKVIADAEEDYKRTHKGEAQ